MSDGMISLPLAEAGGSFWFPPQASEFAAGVDFTYDFILWLCIVFFVGICGFTAYFSIKYRKRPGHKEEITVTHNTRLELAWSIIPLFFLMAIFGISTYWYLIIMTPPTEDITEIEVRAQQWSWNFSYDEKPLDQPYETPNLHVILNRNYQLIMTTPDSDVLHSLFIPAFRVKQDCVPGRYNKLWFKPTMTHTEAGCDEGFMLYCTEYCGQDHSRMLARVFVYETEADWAAGVKKEGDIWDPDKVKPVDRGRILYERNCKSCHSTDGSKVIGPSFKGIWGKEETVIVGGEEQTVTVDENYVRESLINPAAKVVKDYPNQMTPFAFGANTDSAVDGIVAYLKSLKE
jgi:cytochrome c oxidase subunit II